MSFSKSFPWKFKVTWSLLRNSDNSILIKIPHLLVHSKYFPEAVTKSALARNSWYTALSYHMDRTVWLIISQLISSAGSLSHNHESLSSLIFHWLSDVLWDWFSEFSCCSPRVKEIYKGQDFLHITFSSDQLTKTLLPRFSSSKCVLLPINTLMLKVDRSTTQSNRYVYLEIMCTTVLNAHFPHFTFLNTF